MGLGAFNSNSYNFNTLEMTDYETEKQIKQMLDKYQQSDFTKSETRRCIAEVIANRLKKHIAQKDG